MTLKPRSNKKLKTFGAKRKDKFLLRKISRGSKYQMGLRDSFDIYLDNELKFRESLINRYGVIPDHYKQDSYFGRRLSKSIEALYVQELEKAANGGSVRVKPYRQAANRKERSYKRQAFTALLQGNEEKFEKLYLKRYGSMGWEIY